MADNDYRIRSNTSNNVNHPGNDTHLIGQKTSKSNQTAQCDGSWSLPSLSKILDKIATFFLGTKEERLERENTRAEKKTTASVESLAKGIANGKSTEGMIDNCVSIMTQARKSDQLGSPQMVAHDKLTHVIGNMETEDLQNLKDKGIGKLSQELRKICETSKSSYAFDADIDMYGSNLSENAPVSKESESTKQIIRDRKADVATVMMMLENLVNAELENRARLN